MEAWRTTRLGARRRERFVTSDRGRCKGCKRWKDVSNNDAVENFWSLIRGTAIRRGVGIYMVGLIGTLERWQELGFKTDTLVSQAQGLLKPNDLYISIIGLRSESNIVFPVSRF